MTQDAIEVHHVPEQHRYEVRVDGETAGFTEYDLQGDRITFTHTVVDEAFEGRGVGSALVREALDDVRAGGRLEVVAACSFVAGWIEHHPQYADLLA